MPIRRETVDRSKLNPNPPPLPFELRLADFELTMQDVYDFFFDVNTTLEKGSGRFWGARR